MTPIPLEATPEFHFTRHARLSAALASIPACFVIFFPSSPFARRLPIPIRTPNTEHAR